MIAPPMCRLVSLDEIMYEYKIADLAMFIAALKTISRDNEHQDFVGLEKSPYDTPEKRENVAQLLENSINYCKAAEFDDSLLLQMENLAKNLRFEGWEFRRQSFMLS